VATHSVLIVEERGVSKTNLESLVPREGFTVTCVPGYIDALYKISKEHFDIVFASQSMSEMGGIELITSVKALGFENGTRPVFILYCDTNDETVIHQAWAAGFRYVVSKSISPERFSEILNECLGSQEEPPDLEDVADTTDSSQEDAKTSTNISESPIQRGVISILRIEEQGNTLTYHLGGNISKGSGFAELRKSVLSHVTESEKNRIILSCEEINYVNSSGIAGLVSLSNEVAKLGGEMYLTDAQEQVFNVLASLDLLKILQYRPTAASLKKVSKSKPQPE